MPRRLAQDEEWDDDESEDDDDEEEPTIPCPFCEREIHEDSQRCPYCEQYITEETVRPARKSWWVIVGTLLCLYVVYRWIVG